MESEVAVAGACDGEVPPRLEEVGSFAGLSSEEEVDASTITVASGGVVGEVDHEEVVTYSSSRIVATDEVCILVKCVAFIERIALMKRCFVFVAILFRRLARSRDLWTIQRMQTNCVRTAVLPFVASFRAKRSLLV